MKKEDDELLTLDEVVEILRVARSTLYRWTTERKIPAHKVGEHWRFFREDIQRWARGLLVVCSRCGTKYDIIERPVLVDYIYDDSGRESGEEAARISEAEELAEEKGHRLQVCSVGQNCFECRICGNVVERPDGRRLDLGEARKVGDGGDQKSK